MKKIMLYLSIISMLFVLSGCTSQMVSGATPIDEQSYDDSTAMAEPDPPELHGFDIASEWASESIMRAHSLGLIPQSLFAFPTFTDYTLPITRTEFSALAVAFFETVTGKEITGSMSFNDTNDINVQKMGYLGVVSGVGNGNFDPYNVITREQAAVMLANLAEAVGHPLPLWLRGLHPSFLIADYDDISSWAVQSVVQIYQAGIMSGAGDRRFVPQSPYTREQSIITILRLFDMVNAELPNALESADILNYAEFLRRLEMGGFAFETGSSSFATSPGTITIYIDGERLTIECRTIKAPTNYAPIMSITWMPEYLWPTRDLVRVVYSGDDDRIIKFLNETFGYNPFRHGR